jgi:predicted acyl esterase
VVPQRRQRDGPRLYDAAFGCYPAFTSSPTCAARAVPAGRSASSTGRSGRTTAPLDTDLDIVGHLELRLTAAATAIDIAWILLLQDVAPDGTATDVTQGWLRAALPRRLGRPGL